MMNKSNRPLNLPSSGVMVREERELTQLVDCCLYVLPSNTPLDGELVRKHLTELTQRRQFLNQYEMEVLDELPCMCNHPKLSQAFEKDSYNLMMAMREPGASSGRQYLVVKSEEARLGKDISSMISVSEKVTRQSIRGLMIQHALFSSDSFLRSTEHIWESERFSKNYLVRRMEESPVLHAHVLAARYSLLGMLGVGDILTHRKNIELQKKFIDNLQMIKANENDDIAKAEVNLVLECLGINNRDMLLYLKTIPEGLVEQFCKKVIPQKIAEQSEMQMEVRWVGKIDIRRPSEGNIRIFLHKGDQEQQVHFKRRPAFALYLLYLTDVYKSESVDTLRIKDCEKAFCRLFDESYYCGGAESFQTMIGEGNSEQELLRHQLRDIRMAVGNACEKIDEAATPYVLKDANSHLYILKKNVIIDKKLEPLVAELGND